MVPTLPFTGRETEAASPFPASVSGEDAGSLYSESGLDTGLHRPAWAGSTHPLSPLTPAWSEASHRDPAVVSSTNWDLQICQRMTNAALITTCGSTGKTQESQG